MLLPLCVCLALLVGSSQPVSSTPLSLSVTHDFKLRLSVQNHPWLDSSSVRLHADGAWASSIDGSLTPDGATKTGAGEDNMGRFTSHEMAWTTPTHRPMRTQVRDYTADGIQAVVFEQHFPNGANDTALGPSLQSKDDVLSVFPSLQHSAPDKTLGCPQP